jgi:hypothetical protein
MGDCNHALLNSDEQQNVARETHNRDLQQCLEGSDTCDPSRLSDAEQRDVALLSRGNKPSN